MVPTKQLNDLTGQIGIWASSPEDISGLTDPVKAVRGNASLAGDLNGDRRVDIYDLPEAIIHFGNPYNIFTLTGVISNFGK